MHVGIFAPLGTARIPNRSGDKNRRFGNGQAPDTHTSTGTPLGGRTEMPIATGAWDGLVRAQKECKAAQQESAPQVKATRLGFAHFYLHFAQPITDVPVARFGLVPRPAPQT